MDSKSGQKLILDPDEFVTEFIDSEEYTTDVFHLNDQIQTCSRIRREVKQGVCTKAEVFWNETLHEVAVELVKKFKMPTCLIRLLKDEDHAIIDLNLALAQEVQPLAH